MERRAVLVAKTAAWTSVPERLVIALCALALATTALLVSAEPVGAVDLSDRIAAVRAAQRSAESAMRSYDQTIARLDAQRKSIKKQVKPLQKATDQRRRETSVVRGILQTRKDRLAEKEAKYADPSAAPGNAAEILKNIRADIRKAESTLASANRKQQAAVRAVWGKKTQLANNKNARKAAVARREGAEGSLSHYIKQMAELARLKIESQATVSLAEGGTFSWPTTGRISQTYGCTGVVYNPRRGSCKHFHDGIDVVDSYGTAVRAIAAGVVSYAGWNPYDQEGRAYVIDVVHADGYVSRYGHLVPGNRVKAGDLVHTGQIIGKMGSTGKSTGTHLHFEVMRSGKDIDPVSILPAGVVQVDKASTKAGQAALARAAKQAAKPKKAKKTPLPPPAEPFPYATETVVATCSAKDRPAPKDGGPQAVECDPRGLFNAGGPNGPPGVPLPYRGTSPAG